MSETILKLKLMGPSVLVKEDTCRDVPRQAWRWHFDKGVAYNSDDDPVLQYVSCSTLYAFLDVRQMTLTLVSGIGRTAHSAFTANMTLQGLYSPYGYPLLAKGSISAASKEYAKAIGATFEMTDVPGEEYEYQLKIEKDIFENCKAQVITPEEISALNFKLHEFVPQQYEGFRLPPPSP